MKRLTLCLIIFLSLLVVAPAYAVDTTTPSVPASLHVVSNTGNGNITIAWNASTDDVGVAGYRVHRTYNDGGGSRDYNPAGTGTQYTDADGINRGWTYKYSVAAYDAAGNRSAYSPVLTVLVPSTAPPLSGDRLEYTTRTDHSGYLDLAGATLQPNTQYCVSLKSAADVSAPVNFYLDGSLMRTENTAPWDATNTLSSGACGTRTFASGSHTIRATWPSGSTSDSFSVATAPAPSPQCSDGVDNDGDGKVDYPADPGCTSASDNDETDASTGGGADPSGVAMPTGDITGWHQIFTDNFPTDIALGSWPDATGGRWHAYGGFCGTPSWACYDSHATTSVHGGLMDMWIHDWKISAPVPQINGVGVDDTQLYGRYVVRFRTDNFPSYHASWLLWPKSQTWPRDGEIDFPEGDFNSTINAFMHRQNGTSGGDQDAYSTRVPMYGVWHTATIEWTAAHCRFILDGAVIGDSTSRIPNTRMYWVLQNGGQFGIAQPPASTNGHVYIDWVAVYRPA